MREELKHSTSVGSLSGIKLFISLLLDEKITTRSAFSSLCSYISSTELNYLVALYLLDDLQIIQFNGSKLHLTKLGTSLIEGNESERILNIGKIAMQYIIDNNLLNCNDIKYAIDEDVIEIPINAFSLSAAIYRNFLITLNVVSISNNRLIVSRTFNDCFEAICSKAIRKITQEDLLKRLENQQAEGEKGELFVVNYENKRLISSGKKAKRISQIDVTAGYDILSYNDENSTEYDCFIEVKAYHGNPHFYWSDNERNTSMILKDKYYIFLVDIDKISDEYYEPIIICDPYNNLPADTWLIEAQTYYVCKI